MSERIEQKTHLVCGCAIPYREFHEVDSVAMCPKVLQSVKIWRVPTLSSNAATELQLGKFEPRFEVGELVHIAARPDGEILWVSDRHHIAVVLPEGATGPHIEPLLSLRKIDKKVTVEIPERLVYAVKWNGVLGLSVSATIELDNIFDQCVARLEESAE